MYRLNGGDSHAVLNHVTTLLNDEAKCRTVPYPLQLLLNEPLAERSQHTSLYGMRRIENKLSVGYGHLQLPTPPPSFPSLERRS